MSTRLIYNGVTIENCLLKEFQETAERDESGTDILYHRVRIRVSGLVHVYSAPDQELVPGGKPPQFKPAGSSAVSTFNSVRKLLLEERKSLKLQFGSYTVLDVKPASGPSTSGVDVNNGPKPQSVEITRVTGWTTFKVDFAIETAIVDCAANANGSGVLSNRWSCEDDIDDTWRTTRTIRGRLRLSSQFAGAWGPHSFRSWVFPPLQDGYRREHMHFVATPDMLTLEYMITDKQHDAAAPYPGVKWTGKHSEVAQEGGHAVVSEVQVEVEGPPGLPDKKGLISVCARIILGKLNILTQPPGRAPYQLLHSSFLDHLDQPKVEMRYRILRTGDQYQYFDFPTTNLGEWIKIAGQPYDRFKHAVPTEFPASSPAGLFVAYLQTPCNATHAMTQTGQGAVRSAAQRGRVVTAIGKKGALYLGGKRSSVFSSEHRRALYTCYKQFTTYHTRHHRVLMPIADSATSTGDSASEVGLAKPTSHMTVHVVAERLGEWPEIPEAKDLVSSDGNQWKLMDVKVQPQQPQLTADRDPDHATYSVEVKYEYAATRKAGNTIEAGQSPVYRSGIFASALHATTTMTARVFKP